MDRTPFEVERYRQRELAKFDAAGHFCGEVARRTRPFWVTVLIAWVIIMVVCYL